MKRMLRFSRVLGVVWVSCTIVAAVSAAASKDEPFPKPAPEKQFPELKIYDASGRPWRIPQEDWAGAKQHVENDPRWAEWLREQRAELDAWMAKPRDRVEWAAGWSHDGVSEDGARLFWSEKIPREEVEHFSSRTQPRVEITPKRFAWWVVTNRGRNFDAIETAGLLYRLTGDDRYATWAAGQIDFYADNFLKWEAARDGARLFWQTLTEANSISKLTEAVRALGDFVAPERKERWRVQLFYPEVKVLNASYRNVHNIACAQRNTAARVALLYGDEAMWREAIDGPWGVRDQVKLGITSDYLWSEQSLGYNGMVVRALGEVFIAASLHGRIESLAHEIAAVQNLMLSPTYYRFPDGTLPNPADNVGISRAPSAQMFASSYRLFPTAMGLQAIAGRRSWDTLLDPPPPAPPQVPLPEVKSRNLESSRMAILRAGEWQLYFHYGQLTRSHTESEALNYAAMYGRTDVTHDAGTAPYGSPLHLGYFTRGLAHNAPLVDGEGQHLGEFGERREWIVEEPDYTRPMRGELIEFSENPARVAAAQPQYRPDARAQRALAIENGNALIDRATIETTDGQPRKLGLALHVQGKVQLPENFRADASFAEGRSEPFTYWESARAAEYRDRAAFDVQYENGVTMRVTISAPGEFRIWHASTPDIPPRRRESFYLELTGAKTKAEFVTRFEPRKAE